MIVNLKSKAPASLMTFNFKKAAHTEIFTVIYLQNGKCCSNSFLLSLLISSYSNRKSRGIPPLREHLQR